MQNVVKIPTPEKMQKYPWGVTVVSLFAVCIMLLYVVLKKPEGCQEENAYLKQQVAQKDAENKTLVMSILVKNGVISQQEQEKKELDSAIKTKIAPKAKKIIKDN